MYIWEICHLSKKTNSFLQMVLTLCGRKISRGKKSQTSTQEITCCKLDVLLTLKVLHIYVLHIPSPTISSGQRHFSPSPAFRPIVHLHPCFPARFSLSLNFSLWNPLLILLPSYILNLELYFPEFYLYMMFEFFPEYAFILCLSPFSCIISVFFFSVCCLSENVKVHNHMKH